MEDPHQGASLESKGLYSEAKDRLLRYPTIPVSQRLQLEWREISEATITHSNRQRERQRAKSISQQEWVLQQKLNSITKTYITRGERRARERTTSAEDSGQRSVNQLPKLYWRRRLAYRSMVREWTRKLQHLKRIRKHGLTRALTKQIPVCVSEIHVMGSLYDSKPAPLTILQGTILGHPAKILVDGGSTNNFLSADFVQRHALRTTSLQRANRLEFANGKTQAVSQALLQAKVKIGHTYSERMDISITQLNKYDLILGKPWLIKHNPAATARGYSVKNAINECNSHVVPNGSGTPTTVVRLSNFELH